MKFFKIGALGMILAASFVYADETPHEIVVKPHQVIIQVKGIVCSFCAYGVEKNLAKLNSLDSTQFGDGVFLDIHTNRITLALASNQAPDLKGIYQAIKKGGYDPVTVHLHLAGKVTKEGRRYLLNVADFGKHFELTGPGLEQLNDHQAVEAQVHLNAREILSFNEGQPVKVVVDRLEVTP